MDKAFLLLAGGTDLGTKNGFCSQSANIWQVVGYLLLVFRIVIPIVLIILGMLDLGKAVVSSKDDEIKKAAKQLMFRAIAAIAIFFVPTIVTVLIGLVASFGADKGGKEDYEVCKNCINKPNGSECANKASAADK